MEMGGWVGRGDSILTLAFEDFSLGWLGLVGWGVWVRGMVLEESLSYLVVWKIFFDNLYTYCLQ